MSTQVTVKWATECRWGSKPQHTGTVEANPGFRTGRATLARLGLLAAAVSFPIWVMSPLDFVKFGDIRYEYVMGIALMAAGVTLIEGLGGGGFGYRASPWLWGLGVLVLMGLAASLVASDIERPLRWDTVRDRTDTAPRFSPFGR